MTWKILHKESEELAWRAHEHRRRGDEEQARDHFRRAAEAEEAALAALNAEAKPRTFAITAVSACALWYKAGELKRARRVAHGALALPSLDGYAKKGLAELLELMANPERPPREEDDAPDSPVLEAPWRFQLQAHSARPASRFGRSSIIRFAAVVAFIVVAAGLLYFNLRPVTYSTATGQSSTVTLADGSVVHLNTRTELRWIGGTSARRVRLDEGEALFEVVRDETRPFILEVEKAEIRVVGTKFNVREGPDGQLTVDVIEGIVEVRSSGNGADHVEWVRRIPAGERLQFSDSGLLGEPHEIDTAEAIQWREGRYEFRNRPLEDVLDELSRYTDDRIVIRDASIAHTPVGGALNVYDIPKSLEILERSAPVKVTRANGMILIEKAEKR